MIIFHVSFDIFHLPADFNDECQKPRVRVIQDSLK